jgi:hypothetical protein
VIWLLVAVVPIGLLLAWWLGQPGSVGVAGPRLTAAAALDVVSRTNVALGHLENQALDACMPVFEALGREVPQEPLPARNLAVARTVALGDGGLEPTVEAIAAATQAIA